MTRALWILAVMGTGCLGGSNFSGGGGDETDGGPDGDADADTDADGDYDCANLPEGPFEATELAGAIAFEDLAFDGEGHIVGNDGQAIMKSPHDGGPTVFIAPPAGAFRAGMRMLPNGQLVVANDSQNSILRYDEEGAEHPVLSGLSYPNGIAVGLDGNVYFTEQTAERVQRVDPMTGDAVVLTSGVPQPNGLTFSPDYRYLYIGSFCGGMYGGTAGTVYRLEIADGEAVGDVEEWAHGVGNGCHDGMAVDACGNVYVADYASSEDSSTRIFRIAPDGTNPHVVVDPSGEGGGYYGFGGTYLPNMDWGTGQGGFDPMSLYFPEGSTMHVYEVPIGVPSKPRAFP